MPAQSCWERILHPFSAAIKFQKEFANDVLTNVRKQREVFNSHHREMALREQELHLDELEEKYKCCVCGAKGESRDFEPPVVLVNAISEGVTHAAAVVAQRGAKKTSRGAGNASVRLVIPGEGTVTPGETPPLTPSVTPAVSPREAPPESLSDSTGTLPLPSLDEGNSRSSGLTTPTDGAPGPVTSREVRELIERARREIISAQKLKRLEERHKKLGSYHRDKGLMRIHETDIEAFSQFFQKPVRGFLCVECHSGARKRLDVLTQEIQQILARAQKPFVTEDERRPQLSSSTITVTSPTTSSSTSMPIHGGTVPAPLDSSQQQPTGPRARLCTEDILTLRQLAQCGVCMRRHPTYFLRKNVLFLCQFCCAIDRFYRHNAMCINNEWMPLDHVVLLEQLAKQYRGDDASLRQSSRAFLEARVRDFSPQRNLFSQQQNLFVVQDPSLAHPDLPCEVVVDRLVARPDFSKIVEGTIADKQALSRELARSTGTSLFHGKELAPSVNLFDELSREKDDQSGLPRFDDLVHSGSSGQTAVGHVTNQLDDGPSRPDENLGCWNPFAERELRSAPLAPDASSPPSVASQTTMGLSSIPAETLETAAPPPQPHSTYCSDDDENLHEHQPSDVRDVATRIVTCDDHHGSDTVGPSIGTPNEASVPPFHVDHTAAWDPFVHEDGTCSSEAVGMEAVVHVAADDETSEEGTAAATPQLASDTAAVPAADKSLTDASQHDDGDPRQEEPAAAMGGNDSVVLHRSSGTDGAADGALAAGGRGHVAAVYPNDEGDTDRKDLMSDDVVSSPFSGFGFPSPEESRAPAAASASARPLDEYNFASSPLRSSINGVIPVVTPGGYSDFSSFGFPSPPAQRYDFEDNDDLR